LACSTAFANFPKITEFRPLFPLIAGERTVTEVVISGEGFDPVIDQSQTNLKKEVQLNYRKVFPGLGPWQTAIIGSNPTPTNENSPVEISRLGDGVMQIAMFGAITMHPGVWAFTYCVQSVGCSTPVEITVQDPAAAQTILNASVDAPLKTYFDLDLNLDHVASYDLKLKVGSNTLAGFGHPEENRARFLVPATFFTNAGIVNASIFDKAVGVDSSKVMIIVLDKPALQVAPIAIQQALTMNQNPKDANVELKFNEFTFPSEIKVLDVNGVLHTITPPRDLLTNKANLTIPGAWLKLGDFSLELTMKNITGSTKASIPVSISRIVARPNPIPNPIPRPIPRQ
jgi:hypothetical protein